jgi:unsaturated rhamnogalacturonyl hydrolase
MLARSMGASYGPLSYENNLMNFPASIFALWVAGAVAVSAQPAVRPSDDAAILRTLNAVARHQVQTVTDGDYTPVESAAALKAARAPEGISWNYPWGVTLYGVQRSTDFTHDASVAAFAVEHNRVAARYYAFLESMRGKLGPAATKGFKSKIGGLMNLGSLDSCGSMGNQLLEDMLRHPQSVTAEEKKVAARIADWIIHRQDRLPDGTLWRPASNGGVKGWKPGTIWMDDLYMAGPFLVRWSKYTGDNQYLDDAARQILQMAARLQDSDGVWFHAYFVNANRHSPFKWGRANGWGVVATVEVLSEMAEADPLRPRLMAVFRRQMEGVKRLQAPSGMWHQVLDHSELWEETSCTAMFAYGFARAANRGWIDPSNLDVARRAFAGLQSQITADGAVNGTCAGTNIGVDLSFYADRPRPPDDLHGRGVVLLAGSEILAADAPPGR